MSEDEIAELRDRVEKLEREYAALKRLLALAAGTAGGTLPAGEREFWRIVDAHIKQTTPEMFAPHDPDAS